MVTFLFLTFRDDDSDLSVNTLDYPRIHKLLPVLEKFGIQSHNHTTIGLKLSLKSNPPVSKKYQWSWPFVDLWRWERKDLPNNGGTYHVQDFPRRAFLPADIVPGKRAWNDGLLMETPGNYQRWIYVIFNFTSHI
jgi:hypothetical protein